MITPSILVKLKALVVALGLLVATINGTQTAPTKYGASVYNPTSSTISSSTIATAGGLLAANNLSDVSSTSTSANNLAALKKANNLSDVSSTSTALANLGGITKSSVLRPFQFVIESATSTENDAIFIFNATSTINKITAVNKSLNDTITFGLGYSANRQTATSSLNNLFTSAQTVTATTTPVILTINASSTPNTGDNLIFWTTAASSTQFTLTGYYSEN